MQFALQLTAHCFGSGRWGSGEQLAAAALPGFTLLKIMRDTEQGQSGSSRKQSVGREETRDRVQQGARVKGFLLPASLGKGRLYSSKVNFLLQHSKRRNKLGEENEAVG